MSKTLIYKICVISSVFSFCVSKSYGKDARIEFIKEEISQVYSQLKYALGETRENLPTIEVLDRKKNGAAYRRADNKLIFEVKLFEVCQAFEENSNVAIAFILGHELAHFYHHHDWGESGFGTGFMMDKEYFSEKIAEEKDADIYGGFVTYLAGYDFECIVPTLFEKIYEAYGWQEDIQNYPPLTLRKEVISEVYPQVRELFDIYESAKYLTLMGQHELAEISYQYLLRFIKTKEIYNNLASAQLTVASTMTAYDERKFVFPVALDITNPLQRVGADVGRIDLLNEAKSNLEKAIEYDQNYFFAQLNLGCVNILMKQFIVAQIHLNNAEKLAKSNLEKGKVNLGFGILNHYQDKPKDGDNYFEKAKRNAPKSDIRKLVDYNLSGKIPKIKRQLGNEIRGNLEGLDLDNWKSISSIDFDGKIEIQAKSRLVEGSFNIQIKRFKNSILFQYNYPNYSDNQSLVLHRTNKSKDGTFDGVSVGTSSVTLDKAYKKSPPYVLSHQIGHLRFYESKGLVFNIDQNDRIKEWGVFVIY